MDSLKRSRILSRRFLISIFFVLTFYASSLPVLAQDSSSIDTLKKMGKAFAEIAQKASPAVVGLKLNRLSHGDMQYRNGRLATSLTRLRTILSISFSAVLLCLVTSRPGVNIVSRRLRKALVLLSPPMAIFSLTITWSVAPKRSRLS